MTYDIIPTNTCPKTLEELSRRSEAYAQFSKFVHLDVSDDKFAPGFSWPYGEGQMAELEAMRAGKDQLPHVTVLEYEVHLMIEGPLQLGIALARAGARRIIAHVETFAHADSAREAFDMWRHAGARTIGIAVLMDTPLDALTPYASLCEEILVMTIAAIGKQGIPFDERGIARVKELHEKCPEHVIGVDGGISEKNIRLLKKAGASRFCVGSAIEKDIDPSGVYARLAQLVGSS